MNKKMTVLILQKKKKTVKFHEFHAFKAKFGVFYALLIDPWCVLSHSNKSENNCALCLCHYRHL